MAKALLGHVGGPNQLLAAELHRLHQRVCDLEAELARLKEEQADSPMMPVTLGQCLPGLPEGGRSSRHQGFRAPPEPRSSSSSLARPPTA
jgi:hypothetical protein